MGCTQGHRQSVELSEWIDRAFQNPRKNIRIPTYAPATCSLWPPEQPQIPGELIPCLGLCPCRKNTRRQRLGHDMVSGWHLSKTGASYLLFVWCFCFLQLWGLNLLPGVDSKVDSIWPFSSLDSAHLGSSLISEC